MSAMDWLNQTGQGVMDDLEREREVNGWDKEDSSYLERKMIMIDGKCDFFFG